MSPPNFESNMKPDTNLEIPEPIIDKKPEKQPEVKAETEVEVKPTPVPTPETKIARCRRRLKERTGCLKKRCRWFVVLGCVLIVTTGILGVVAIKQHFKLLHKVIMKHQAIINGRIYPEVYEVDYDKKLTSIKNARSGIVFPADILSDFKQLMVAYRDINSNVCFVDKLTMSFEKSLKNIAKKKKIKPDDVKQVIPSSQPVGEMLLRRFAGEHIVRHCAGLPTYWIVDVRPFEAVLPLPIPETEDDAPPPPSRT